jgi:AcrR family transcriptional regulator
MNVTAGNATSARARSREATRNRLLSSARTLFSSRGLHRVTSHDIAREAGVAAGTFYLHFKDKESLFRELVYDAIEQLRGRLQRALSQSETGAAAVRAHAEALVSFAEEHRELVRIVFARDHGAAEVETDVLDYLATVGAEVLKHRMMVGTFRPTLDPAVASQALTGMFARVVAWWIEDPTRASREAIVETLVQIQLAGTTQDTQAVSQAKDPGTSGRRSR